MKYKEDSTKGKSRIMPKKYKGDTYVQCWLDSRKLATLSKWLDEDSDHRTRFLSDIIKYIVDMVIEHLVKVGEVEMIDLTEDARDMLTRKYRTNLNPSGRGTKNVLHNLTLDNMRMEGRIVDADLTTPQQQGNESKFDLDEAVRIYKDIERKEIHEQARRDLEEAKKNLKFDENGVVILPKGKVSGVVYEEDMKAFEKRERNREEVERLDKEKRKVERRKEKILRKMKEMEKSGNGTEGREENGQRDEGERTDAGGDSTGV